MKRMTEREKAVKRLAILRRRLQILGVVLAIVGIGSTVQLLRTEISVKPETTVPTQIQVTEENKPPRTNLVPAETEMVIPEETKLDEADPANSETLAVQNETGMGSEGDTGSAGDIPEAENGANPSDNLNEVNSGPAGELADIVDPDGGTKEDNNTPAADNSGTDDKLNTNESTSDNSVTETPENSGEIVHGKIEFQEPQVLPRPFTPQLVPETEPTIPELPEPQKKPVNLWLILAIVSDGLLILDLIAIAVVQRKLKKLEQETDVISVTEKIPWHAVPPKIGKVHGIGGRDYQQDSLGHTQVLNGGGALAIVADGMGGLSNGEQVSQQIVMDGLGYGAAMTGIPEGNPLLGMVRQINSGVNRMLGPEGIYKCGSTLIAVLVAKDQFHWVSVGDSRIYLYREGFVNQLNTDHDLFQQWMPEILAGTRNYDEAARSPDGRKLTSFIGMGELKYVDYSRQPIDLAQGDRLILVTDGVYGTVPPEQLAEILKANPEIPAAAKVLERRILEAKMPHQDNYTALILGF